MRQIIRECPPQDNLSNRSHHAGYNAGTGRTPTVGDVGAMHRAIRERLGAIYGEAGADIRILYGGSVKASNAAEIFAVPDVDGALVGGASLKAADFLPTVVAAAG